jgi:hypothetical protein
MIEFSAYFLAAVLLIRFVVKTYRGFTQNFTIIAVMSAAVKVNLIFINS